MLSSSRETGLLEITSFSFAAFPLLPVAQRSPRPAFAYPDEERHRSHRFGKERATPFTLPWSAAERHQKTAGTCP